MTGARRKSAQLPRLDEELDLDDFPRSLTPQLAAALVRLLTRVEAMGLIEPSIEINATRFEQVFHALEAARIGISQVEYEKVASDPKRAVDVLTLELEGSPVPQSTWAHLSALLGLKPVALLVGVSDASARRYLSGARTTPDDVAFRLHILAMIVADLAGSYNAYGIRRWFSRPRSALRGMAPSEILRGRWDPDDDDVRTIRDLAAALTAPSST